MARPKRLPNCLIKRHFKALKKAARSDRDRLILSIGFYSGLRVAELSCLRVEHIHFDQGHIFVLQGKGNRDRCVPLHRKLAKKLRGWIGSRTEGWLLPGRKDGTHLTTRAIQWIMEGCVKRAGLLPTDGRRRPTCHSLRHGFASRMIQEGADIVCVRDLLGHGSIAVTNTYAHANPKRLKGAVELL
jgi:integrase